MPPATHHLELYRGDTYAWQIKLWHNEIQTDAVDLTGATAAGEIRDTPGGAAVMALDCVITLPNVIDVGLEAATWNPGPWGAWDVQVTFPGGEVRTVVAGKVTVTGDVTGSTPVVRLVRPGRRMARPA